MSSRRLRDFVRLGAWLVLATLVAGAAEPRPAKVGVLTDNYPFSFRDTDGEVKGFAFEMVREIERVMDLRFERTEGRTPEINGAFMAGRLDVLQSFAHSPEREEKFDFSFPYLTMAGAIFVREGETRIAALADLRGRRVAVHRGSLGEDLLRAAGLADSIRYVDSVEQSLVQLDRGEADATLATRLSGLALAHRSGLKRIRVVPGDVPGYEVRYCIAVAKGERELLARVNEGLAILVRTGRFDVIYRRWFGQVEPRRYSAADVALVVAAGLALALAVALWAFLRQRTLRLRIAQQAAEIRRSEERLRAVFEGAHDGLVVLGPALPDGDFPVEQANPSARRLLGLPATGTAPGLRALLPADSPVPDFVAAGRPEAELECAGRTGRWRVSVAPLGDRRLLTVADVTEAAEARERLRRQEAQMVQKQKLEAVGTLAGGVAHDFNNLLTAIVGNTELAQLESGRGHPAEEYLQRVLQAARRAGQLAKQILTFSRQAEPTRERLAVTPLIEETLGLVRSVARGKVDLVHERAAELPGIVADPAQVHQVLMNIATNAVQAMAGRHGVLTVTEEAVELGAEVQSQHPALRPGAYVRIGVRDTGPGMAAEVQARIFEPFFTTKELGSGTGLGLSVVHGIMERHGGAVTVYSQPGRGTLFHVYFPAATGAAPSADPDLPPPRGAGERVLFVDDDPVIARTAGEILVRLGYRPSVHTRAEDALAELAGPGEGFAAVVSDLAMPGCGGLELAARVRTLRPGLPIVLASGFFSGAERQAADTLGIEVCLHKPLTLAALGRGVARCLGRGSAPPFPD